MTTDDDLPVLVGAAQLTVHVADHREAPTPLDMLEQVAAGACAEAGSGVVDAVDTIFMLPNLHWGEPNPGQALSDRLKTDVGRTVTCEMGGEIGVKAVNWLAEEVLAGRVRCALLATSENVRTVDLAARAETVPDWPVDPSHAPQEMAYGASDQYDGSKYALPDEVAAGFFMPIVQYPAIESAIRASNGMGIDEHRASLGRLFAPFTEVAARNPYAWFPIARSAEELVMVTPQNRMVGFPYTKLLNAILSIDQAAALVMTSVGEARALGIPEERWIHWWGGAAAAEPALPVAARRHLHRSYALAETHTTALANAGVGSDDIAHFDLYSCFPAPVQIACDVLGLAHDDPRGLTVTGGLPYAGGPGSGYTVHSLATMYEVLRANPDDVGMVTGNGMAVTKHSAAILSHRPPVASRPTAAMKVDGPTRDPEAAPLPLEQRSASGVVDGYTVLHGRDGGPQYGVVIGHYDDGVRFVANLPDDASGLEEFERAEQVGRTGDVRLDEPAPVFEPR